MACSLSLFCEWQACRARYDVVDIAWLVVQYGRAQRKVSLSLKRRIHIRAASFNLNAFSSQLSSSLFRFYPVQVGHLKDMLHMNVEVGQAGCL